MSETIQESNVTPEAKQFLNAHRIYVKAMSFEATTQTLEQQIDPKNLIWKCRLI